MSLVITDEQRATLAKHAHDYVEWLKTEKGKDNVAEHREHEQHLKEKLSPQYIDRMTEDEFKGVYGELWASSIWSNKDWYITNKLIAPNGLDKIKTELKKLLYGAGDIAARYDEFRNNIRGFGAAMISEILNMVFPEKYCLWNEKPKTVLPFLGLNVLPEKFFKYQLEDGGEYLQCVQALDSIRNELTQFGVKDFIDLDIFFWHIFDDVIPSPGPIKRKGQQRIITAPVKINIESHEGAEFYLLELGKMLGYFPYTVDQSKTFQGRRLGDVALLQQIPSFAGERDLSTVREIDVIWFNDEENPKYCFEVEHTTDIVHGLDRLIQLKHLYVKLVIVAPEERRSKYEGLLQRVQYRNIQDRFRFISYEELGSLYGSAAPFHQLKMKLLGED